MANAESIRANGCPRHADEGMALAVVDNIAFAIDLVTGRATILRVAQRERPPWLSTFRSSPMAARG
jgi:hypothetical protein